MILIRADANTTIATGHVMRCLSIADGIKAMGGECIFVTADTFPDSFIEGRGFKHICLNSDYKNMYSELDAMRELVREYKPNVVLVDSYFVTKEYFDGLREFVKVAYIDDVNAFDYPVDILINYSVYGESVDYKLPDGCAKLLGTTYAPVRRQFSPENATAYYLRDRNILITAGGVDFDGMIKLILQKLLEDSEFNDYDFTVMVGKTYNDDSVLKISNPRVKIYQNVSDVATLMKNAMFAVSAGGSTLYELCALQTPTVTFSVVDNQLGNVREFDNRGIFKYAGDTRNGKESVVEKVAEYLREGLHNADNNLIGLMKSCVDGRGAERIAEYLMKTD